MKRLFIAFRFLLFMTILTGCIYPTVITMFAQIIFPEKSTGSVVFKQGKPRGSLLIGQSFEQDKYFHPRPSATGYNPLPSGGSNLGPTSRKLLDQVTDRRHTFLTLNGLSPNTEIPSGILFASGSGLDPHITPVEASLQVQRVAAARRYPDQKAEQINELIKNLTEKPTFGFIGEERINVLLLNLALDNLQ